MKDYEDLTKTIIGFGDGLELVNKLKDFCSSHGIHNTTELLEAVNTYGNLLDIKKEIKESEGTGEKKPKQTHGRLNPSMHTL